MSGEAFDWPAALRTLATSRDPARLRRVREQVAAATLRSAEALRPDDVPDIPARLARIRSLDDAKGASADDVTAIRAHVHDVTQAEELNHGRLRVLLEAIAVLRESDDEATRAIGDDLAVYAGRQYPGIARCLRGGPLPKDRAERMRLARAASRDYGRCPKAWRWV